MNMLILNAEQAAEIAEMNIFGNPYRRIEPIQLPDGRYALNSDILMDCDPGETWWHYRTVLMDLPADSVTRFTADVDAIEKE